MNGVQSISKQLRRRRQALGLSLSEVARRAGTSPATLSRYENGWTRFESYTLRKLAVSLNCELRIELCPVDRAAPTSVSHTKAVTQLGRLFWDHPLSEEDIEKHPVWVTERVLEYGNLEDVATLRSVMGRSDFVNAVAGANKLSPRTRSLWSQILQIEGVSCMKAYSRNTAWNS